MADKRTSSSPTTVYGKRMKGTRKQRTDTDQEAGGCAVENTPVFKLTYFTLMPGYRKEKKNNQLSNKQSC